MQRATQAKVVPAAQVEELSNRLSPFMVKVPSTPDVPNIIIENPADWYCGVVGRNTLRSVFFINRNTHQHIMCSGLKDSYGLGISSMEEGTILNGIIEDSELTLSFPKMHDIYLPFVKIQNPESIIGPDFQVNPVCKEPLPADDLLLQKILRFYTGREIYERR